ncbi:MAG: hypothetical protein HND44_23285 [Chloroflexi bacterium]|nr:hypothetical protein [Ardenticatenaceae bacterium]MBL1131365.1 hypothetical protein [Chloroflexota bacterium]NOG37467.1 hypothetical protein [Chloroflexota bacterium]
MRLKFVFLLTMMLALITSSLHRANAHNGQAVQATIGDGTAASCQTQDAANALSSAVAAGGTIDFNCGPEMVTIVVNTNATDQTVVVNGNGRITLDGEDLRQIFNVYGNGNLTLNDLILIDGNTGSGGGLVIGPQASATINRGMFISNVAANYGGAIYNEGILNLNDSSLGSNIAGNDGGGIYNNGGVVNVMSSYLISNQAFNGGGMMSVGGTVQVEMSALRSNIATGWGGGIYASGGAIQVVNNTFSNNRADQGGGLYKTGTAVLTNNTFSENRADNGGALYNGGGTSAIKNNIFANSLNEAGGGPSLNCDGPTLTSAGRNIISDNSCVPNPSIVGDRHSTDPLLGIWQAQGGPARAYALLPGSPAIDYALDCPTVDQRGWSRPLGAACDVGSIEYGGIIYLPLVVK